jgi:hypothetical protein
MRDSGHAGKLESLIRRFKLAASCAQVDVFVVIVLTELDSDSEQMVTSVKNKVSATCYAFVVA